VPQGREVRATLGCLDRVLNPSPAASENVDRASSGESPTPLRPSHFAGWAWRCGKRSLTTAIIGGSIRWALLIVAILLSAACGDHPATASAADPTLSPHVLAEARTFRETVGLRSDDAWMTLVAKDPSSQEDRRLFGVPLLPSEVAEMMARTKAYTDAGPVILDYARTVPDDWFGSYIDQERGGLIVAEFLRNTEQHRAALEQLLPPTARWEVRQVDQRTLDRIAFVERVKTDSAWFATIDAELLDVVTNPVDGGIVELTYIAARRDLDPVILDHYGDPEWLRVERAGGPPWRGPVGTLVVKAVDMLGQPVPDLTCSVGGGDTALLTDRDGTCRYDRVAAVDYHVQLRAGIEESTHVVGSADVHVKPNESTLLTMVVLGR
jgi:hypothetical protein